MVCRRSGTAKYVIRRHNSINQCIAKFARRIGAETVELEPHLGLHESRLRPDFKIELPDSAKTELADGVCIHTLAPSRAGMSIDSQFKQIDTHKFQKYYQNPEIASGGYPFTTICSTTFGLLSASAYELLDRIIRSNATDNYLTSLGSSMQQYRRAAFVQILDELLIAIQRGNAAILRSSVQHCLCPSTISLLRDVLSVDTSPMESVDPDGLSSYEDCDI